MAEGAFVMVGSSERGLSPGAGEIILVDGPPSHLAPLLFYLPDFSLLDAQAAAALAMVLLLGLPNYFL